MAHFYGSMSGQAKTKATRRGSERSGINAHIRGWDLGVEVYGFVDTNGNDCFDVILTGGFNTPSKRRILGSFLYSDLVKVTG